MDGKSVDCCIVSCVKTTSLFTYTRGFSYSTFNKLDPGEI